MTRCYLSISTIYFYLTPHLYPKFIIVGVFGGSRLVFFLCGVSMAFDGDKEVLISHSLKREN